MNCILNMHALQISLLRQVHHLAIFQYLSMNNFPSFTIDQKIWRLAMLKAFYLTTCHMQTFVNFIWGECYFLGRNKYSLSESRLSTPGINITRALHFALHHI